MIVCLAGCLPGTRGSGASTPWNQKLAFAAPCKLNVPALTGQDTVLSCRQYRSLKPHPGLQTHRAAYKPCCHGCERKRLKISRVPTKADMPEHAQGFIYVLDATGKTKQGWPLQMGEVQAQASTCTPHAPFVEEKLGNVMTGKQGKDL